MPNRDRDAGRGVGRTVEPVAGTGGIRGVVRRLALAQKARDEARWGLWRAEAARAHHEASIALIRVPGPCPRRPEPAYTEHEQEELCRRLWEIMDGPEIPNPDFTEQPAGTWIGLVVQDPFREMERTVDLMGEVPVIREIYIVWRGCVTQVRGDQQSTWKDPGRELEAWLAARVVEHGDAESIAKLRGFDISRELAAQLRT